MPSHKTIFASSPAPKGAGADLECSLTSCEGTPIVSFSIAGAVSLAPGLSHREYSLLYGVPGRTYRLEPTTALPPPVDWQNGPTVTLTNSFFTFPGSAITNTARFYRVRQLGSSPALLNPERPPFSFDSAA